MHVSGAWCLGGGEGGREVVTLLVVFGSSVVSLRVGCGLLVVAALLLSVSEVVS